MTEDRLTIADRIQNKLDELTRAERQLAHSILENYPASGLGPLSALANGAGVSVPTVARMVQKLGFDGYPEFQTVLREELKAKVQSPIAKHDTWAERAPSEHLLNRTTRHLYIAGGRVTHTLAEYLFMHMQVIRPQITHIQSTSNTWPHYLLDLRKGDVVVVFDMRRYENNTLKLAEMAHAKGAQLILFTDQWRSPVHQLADVTFSSRIVVPSAWDSAVTPMLLLETMIAAVQNLTWGETKDRMTELEQMFDQTKLFRKFT